MLHRLATRTLLGGAGLGTVVRSVPSSTPIADAIRAMIDGRTGTLLVADDGLLRGVMSEKDYMTRLSHGSFPPKDLTVGQIMQPQIEVAHPDAPVSSILSSMLAIGRRHIPVLSDAGAASFGSVAPSALPVDFPVSALGGVLSMRDCVNAAAEGVAAVEPPDEGGLQWNSRVDRMLGDMKAKGRTVLINTRVGDKLSVADAVNRLAEVGSSCLLVVSDEGQIAGVFTSRDFLTKVVCAGLNAAATHVTDVMTPRPTTVSTDASLLTAARRMAQGRFRHLPVVVGDGSGSPGAGSSNGGADGGAPAASESGGGGDLCLGIVSMADLARAFVTPDEVAAAAAAAAAADPPPGAVVMRVVA